MIRLFLKDIKANISVIYAISAIALVGVVGAAIDYVSMSKKQSEYQSYADSAVLFAAASGEKDEELLRKMAKKVVAANNTSGEKLETNFSITKDQKLRVVVKGAYQMKLMGIFGKGESILKGKAEAPPKDGGKLNVSLVLDVTASMMGTKLATLKTAATNLVEGIMVGDNGETMVSVVPFARYVKLPLSYKKELWLETEPAGNHCYDEVDETKSTNCKTVGSGAGQYFDCDSYVFKNICVYKEWEGCMGSRSAPHNASASYILNKLQGFTIGDWCAPVMLPLTNSLTDIKAHISSLYAIGSTYIPSGVIWGWRSLTPEAPLVEANTVDKSQRSRVMVIMTDGKNSSSIKGTTATFNGVYHKGIDFDGTDSLTSTLCEKIKAEDILVFTVAFEVTDADTIDMMRNCASSGTNFYEAKNSSALVSAFEEIGKRLGQVRLSK